MPSFHTSLHQKKSFNLKKKKTRNIEHFPIPCFLDLQKKNYFSSSFLYENPDLITKLAVIVLWYNQYIYNISFNASLLANQWWLYLDK